MATQSTFAGKPFEAVTAADYEAMTPADRRLFDAEWLRRCGAATDPLADDLTTPLEDFILAHEDWSRS